MSAPFNDIVQTDMGASAQNLLLHYDCVCTVWKRRACKDLYRTPALERVVRDMPCCNAPYDCQFPRPFTR